MFLLLFCHIFLVNSGMCSQPWAVNYLNKMKCVLRGSTTFLSGNFTYPEDLTLTDSFWTVDPVKGKATPDLSKEPEYKDRVEYFHSKDRNLVLKLSGTAYEDEKMYCIRIVTDKETEKYLGYPGVELKVTELNVKVPEEVLEGNSAVLFCTSTCNFASTTEYRWYKNKRPLSESFRTKELSLYPVSSDDAGEYSCALRKHEDLPSPALTLNVRYPPKKTSVSISSSGEIVEGDSVTLTCTCESNPPVHNFTWFTKNQTSSVGSGQSFRALESGWFYCVAQNKYGSQRSAAVSVMFGGGRSKVLHITAGIVTALFCSCAVIVLIRIVRRKTADSGVSNGSKQQNVIVTTTDQIPAHPTASASKQVNQNDCYASIVHHRPSALSRDQTADDEEVQYASVNHSKNTKNNKEEAESHYGNISNRYPAISSRSNAGLVEDSSVIYSGIKSHKNIIR